MNGPPPRQWPTTTHRPPPEPQPPPNPPTPDRAHTDKFNYNHNAPAMLPCPNTLAAVLLWRPGGLTLSTLSLMKIIITIVHVWFLLRDSVCVCVCVLITTCARLHDPVSLARHNDVLFLVSVGRLSSMSRVLFCFGLMMVL